MRDRNIPRCGRAAAFGGRRSPRESAAVLLICYLAATAAVGCAPSGDVGTMRPSPVAPPDGAGERFHDAVVEASCGQCQFGLSGSGCDLAVRIDGAACPVDGTGIDDHGDAHAADGFRSAVRRARVSGYIEDDRFVATRFELVPPAQE